MEKLSKKLKQFGLTNEEASLYVFLLQMKSGTIREIHNSKEYCLKQRSNLYKILNNLKEKKFVTEEVKSGKKRFFAVAPHLILHDYIAQQARSLEKLKEISSSLSESLESILKTPYEGYSAIPEPLLDFICEVVNEDWSVKEPPEVIKNRDVGTLYSIEFDTHRKFAGHSAGLALHIFRYQTHRDDSLEEVKQFQRKQFETALNSLKQQGFFQLEEYWVDKEFLEIEGTPFHHPYTVYHVKSNVSKESRSGMTILLFKDHPTKIISVWGADLQDFFDLVKRIVSKFAYVPLPRGTKMMKRVE